MEVTATLEAGAGGHGSAGRPAGLVRRAWAPLVGGSVLASAAIYVGVVTPRAGRTIPCPFHAATGLWCPGCGMTRAVHSLLRGDVAAAVSFNVFVPLVVIATAIGWWSWFAGRAWARPVRWPGRVDTRWWLGLGALVIAFGVVRNVAAFDALAP